MSALGDSLTIGIVLFLIFGAVCFYLYSRLSQNEKRIGLLENLLMSLKLSTEASLGGPDYVEPTSGPAPLGTDDVEDVSEEKYADLLKEMPFGAPPSSPAPSRAEPYVEKQEVVNKEEEQEEKSVSRVEVNYESLSVKELQGLARQRGLSGVPSRKRELIDALKKQGDGVPAAPTPLAPVDGEMEGASGSSSGFTVELENA